MENILKSLDGDITINLDRDTIVVLFQGKEELFRRAARTPASKVSASSVLRAM